MKCLFHLISSYYILFISTRGNTILRNGAGGALVESARSVVTTIVRNRVWANSGCDLRQSPARQGLAAGESGAVVLGNTVGRGPHSRGGREEVWGSSAMGLAVGRPWQGVTCRAQADGGLAKLGRVTLGGDGWQSEQFAVEGCIFRV